VMLATATSRIAVSELSMPLPFLLPQQCAMSRRGPYGR
jgi:hypothetical protein